MPRDALATPTIRDMRRVAIVCVPRSIQKLLYAPTFPPVSVLRRFLVEQADVAVNRFPARGWPTT